MGDAMMWLPLGAGERDFLCRGASHLRPALRGSGGLPKGGEALMDLEGERLGVWRGDRKCAHESSGLGRFARRPSVSSSPQASTMRNRVCSLGVTCCFEM